MLPDAGEEGIDRVRGQGTALAESAPSLTPQPWTLPSPSPHSAGPACACFASAMPAPIPSTSRLQPLRRYARYFATLLANSHLSIWFSQIVQCTTHTRTFVRKG